MKYVVFVIDRDTGMPIYGDIPTSQSHAQQWANKYIRDGEAAGIAPYVVTHSIPKGKEDN